MTEQLLIDFNHRTATGTWSERVTGWIVGLAPVEQFTSDAIHARFDPTPSENALGGLINRAEASRLIRYANRDVRSFRPEARGRWVRVWERT